MDRNFILLDLSLNNSYRLACIFFLVKPFSENKFIENLFFLAFRPLFCAFFWVIQIFVVQGFKRVFNVAGGIHAYAVKVDPSVPTY